MEAFLLEKSTNGADFQRVFSFPFFPTEMEYPTETRFWILKSWILRGIDRVFQRKLREIQPAKRMGLLEVHQSVHERRSYLCQWQAWRRLGEKCKVNHGMYMYVYIYIYLVIYVYSYIMLYMYTVMCVCVCIYNIYMYSLWQSNMAMENPGSETIADQPTSGHRGSNFAFLPGHCSKDLCQCGPGNKKTQWWPPKSDASNMWLSCDFDTTLW